jgi:broad specificity phosphatase PhoE
VIATAQKKIVMARHGETTANHCGVIMGRSDCPLTANGRSVAEKVGRLIRKEHVAAAFSSSLGRALTSTGIYTDGMGIPIFPRDGLAELASGQWEGRLHGEVTKGKRCLRDNWFDRPPGGESYNDAEPRARSVVLDLSSEDTPTRLLVVGHAGINRILLKLLLDLDPEIVPRIRCPHDIIYVIQDGHVEARSASGTTIEGLLLAG